MHQWNYAIFSSTASSLSVTHLKIAVGKVGLNLNVFGPNPVAHLLGKKSIVIRGTEFSLFVAYTNCIKGSRLIGSCSKH